MLTQGDGTGLLREVSLIGLSETALISAKGRAFYTIQPAVSCSRPVKAGKDCDACPGGNVHAVPASVQGTQIGQVTPGVLNVMCSAEFQHVLLFRTEFAFDFTR